MSNDELNDAVVKAKNGCKESRQKVLEWYIRLVNKTTIRIWFKINNECNFERKCLKNLDYMIKRFERERGNFSSVAIIDLERVTNDYMKNRSSKRKHLESLDEVARQGDQDSRKRVAEPRDVLADVEGDYITKEMAALLAQGDPKKMMILRGWIDGNTDSRVAQMLAHLYGGKPESHRQAVKRFRKDCRTTLSQVA
ncbi:hypothetical protein [Brevibacillus daliensis]|uniref:hypothetical protein n=1 Tax=Brevibacillus daliensis TaxID=2892995 RepID=UPI001E5B51D6|nr:hypothetical protein [Brevibacillus daliensis]